MNPRQWTVAIIEPNKFECQIMVDILRNAGVEKWKVFTDSAEALEALELYPATLVIGAVEMGPLDGASWTRQFRRNHNASNRKVPIFLTSRAFSRTIAEECRHAGANALIGKPLSAKILIATIQKVLASPRPFIDAPGYVGPCRRAGIVTAGAPKRRRKSDDAQRAAADAGTLAHACAALNNAVTALIIGADGVEPCQAALKKVQAFAANAGDGPLQRACAAFSLQLTGKDLNEPAKAALNTCLDGVTQLAATSTQEAEKRERIAEDVREAVARAASLKAA